MPDNISIVFIFISISIYLFSGVIGLFFQKIFSITLTCIAAIFGIIGVIIFYSQGAPQVFNSPWFLPVGEFATKLDGLNSIFLLSVFLVSFVGAIYSYAYLNSHHTEEEINEEKPIFDKVSLQYLLFNLLCASMAVILLANNGILFLISWEFMAISAGFLINFDHKSQQVRQSAWIYFVTAKVSAFCLLSFFIIWNYLFGSFDFTIFNPSLLGDSAPVMFGLLLLGFGIKAGIMPLHIWLPGAHANAPSHISAILSGVVIKMGAYGLLRFFGLMHNLPEEYGIIMLAVGAISAVFGIVFALSQQNFKRVLAYSSIENMGIICMGIGLALIGRANNQPAWVVLGMGGAILHILNHSLFKSALFLMTGAIIQQSKTFLLSCYGGLAKKMPKTAIIYFVAIMAISGLPPLNAFISELFLYLGFFRGLGILGDIPKVIIVFFAPILAFVGALAIVCFTRIYGLVFLGENRSNILEDVKEVNPIMLYPAAFLVVLCVSIGIFPIIIFKPVTNAINTWNISGTNNLPPIFQVVPLYQLGTVLSLFVLVTACSWYVFGKLIKLKPSRVVETWGCGYVKSSPRIQYTPASFSQIIIDLFSWFLKPNYKRELPAQIFPGKSSFSLQINDSVLENIVLPLFKNITKYIQALRLMQKGYVHFYLMYIFLFLLVLLVL